MDKIAELSPMTLVIVAAIIGFFVVSKLFDFFKKGSTWEERPSTPSTEPPEEPEVLAPTQHTDPQKRQEEEYKRFLEDEKKRQRGG